MKLTQKQIDEMVDQLYEKVKDSGCEIVVGIAYSGLHISFPLAKKLQLPHTFVRVSYYEEREKRYEPIVVGSVPKKTKILVVDDLIDTGSTFKTFNKHFGRHKTAVLFWKPGSFIPDYYVTLKPDEWVIFPWDDK